MSFETICHTRKHIDFFRIALARGLTDRFTKTLFFTSRGKRLTHANHETSSDEMCHSVGHARASQKGVYRSRRFRRPDVRGKCPRADRRPTELARRPHDVHGSRGNFLRFFFFTYTGT